MECHVPSVSIMSYCEVLSICDYLSTRESISLLLSLISDKRTQHLGSETLKVYMNRIKNKVDAMIDTFKWKFPGLDSQLKLNFNGSIIKTEGKVDKRRVEAIKRYNSRKYCQLCGRNANATSKSRVALTPNDFIYLISMTCKLVCLNCIRKMYVTKNCGCGIPGAISYESTGSPTHPYLMSLQCGKVPTGFPGCCDTKEIITNRYYRNGVCKFDNTFKDIPYLAFVDDDNGKRTFVHVHDNPSLGISKEERISSEVKRPRRE